MLNLPVVTGLMIESRDLFSFFSLFYFAACATFRASRKCKYPSSEFLNKPLTSKQSQSTGLLL
jgi:hypothetical protein